MESWDCGPSGCCTVRGEAKARSGRLNDPENQSSHPTPPPAVASSEPDSWRKFHFHGCLFWQEKNLPLTHNHPRRPELIPRPHKTQTWGYVGLPTWLKARRADHFQPREGKQGCQPRSEEIPACETWDVLREHRNVPHLLFPPPALTSGPFVIPLRKRVSQLAAPASS